jgi:hypothetical protein
MIAASFLSGVTMATFVAAGFFFWKFYRASGDRFFFHFAIACWLIGSERVVGAFVQETLQSVRASLDGIGTYLYIIRLIAFALILMAVIRKNRTKSTRF